MFDAQTDQQFIINLLLIAVFVTTIAVGWWIGFKNARKPEKQTPLSVVQSYYSGLNYLVGGQPEDAVDTFIEALEVNTETFEIHLALGNFLRGRGEVDRAIRIHQNLLARSGMGKKLRDTAHLELARDYMSAGVYDRAERLLEELAEESKSLKDLSLKLLVDIYQAEKDWQKALITAEQLKSRNLFFKDRSPEQKYLLSRIAHYHCEIASKAMQDNAVEVAKEHIEQALEIDENCARASLIKADIANNELQHEQAVKSLRRVRKQNKRFIPETLQPLSQAFVYLNDSQQHQKELQECLDLRPSISVALALCDVVEKNSNREQALGQLKNFLNKHANQRGLLRLIDYELQDNETQNNLSSKENLYILREVLSQLINERAIYQCQHCGFSGKQLHWLCPSCKQWGMVSLIQGIKGD